MLLGVTTLLSNLNPRARKPATENHELMERWFTALCSQYLELKLDAEGLTVEGNSMVIYPGLSIMG